MKIHKFYRKSKFYDQAKSYFKKPETPIYWNKTVDKGTMKRMIAWFLVNYGHSTTVAMIEDLKQVGFQQATRAGISLGIEDLRIPPSKPKLLSDANREINIMETRYHQGYVSVVERFQKVIDTWNSTSEMLKDHVVENFLQTDPLNPVYMMAFSGARGNLSQVRQLVGMRGLMSNPQGEIIDLPIRSNFREGLTATEYIISCYGARKGLVDTALRTANSGYLTRRLVDVAQDIVIRITDCRAKGTGLPLKSFHENNQVAYPLEERLLGRVLSLGAVNESGQRKFPPNTPISQAIASELMRSSPELIFVRSVLLCRAKRGLCRLCYGWNLGTGTIVSIGEAVGIIAAQSIGEPGTQLTMRTFHTGGVFSGLALDELRAPHEGVVHYPQTIKSQLIRTRHGEPGILTSEDGHLIFSDGKRSTTLFCKAGSILTVSEGDKVHENQLIGEIASYAGKPVTSWQTLKSDIDGEVTFDQLEVLKRRPGTTKQTSSLKIDPFVSNKGYLWILHGDVSTFEIPMKLVARTGDQVERQSIVGCANRVSPLDGRVSEEETKSQTTLRKIILTRTFGSFEFDRIEAWLPTEDLIIQKEVGKISVDREGMHLAIPPSKTEGLLNFDWPAFSQLSEEENDGQEPIPERSSYPAQYSMLEEKTYMIEANQSWIVNVLAGQSVGPNQSVAKHSGSHWNISEGKLYLESLDYHVQDQSWIQLQTPSLLEIESGQSHYAIIAKAGWIIPVIPGTRVKDYTMITGSILFGKWALPVSRFALEEATDYPAILIRPLRIHPVYPANIWDDHINYHDELGSSRQASWYPRTIAPSLKFPFPADSLGAHQTFAGQPAHDPIKLDEQATSRDQNDEERILEMRLEHGRSQSPVEVAWKWPTTPWISPKHGALPSRLMFVANTILLHRTQVETNHCQERIIPNTGTSAGVNRLTPIVNQMIFSQDEGEIQRLLPVFRYKLKLVVRRKKTRAKVTAGKQMKGKARQHPEIIRRQAKVSRRNRKQGPKKTHDFESKLMRRMVVVRAEHMATFATYGIQVAIPVGAMIYQGEELLQGYSSPVSGQVIEIRRDRVTLRLGKPYRVGWQARVMVLPQEIVKAEKILAHLLYFKTKTGDIVQGLPKIEEVLEARRKKGNDIIRYNPQDIVHIVHQKYLRQHGGMEKASIYTMVEMQVRLLRRVQLVYRSQGVEISDKHIEIIVLRMTSRVLIEHASGTGILPGEIIEKRRADNINRTRKRLKYHPVVLGITKAALTTKGFISGASFQETTRVLTQATLQGKSDWLLGLKENVILGRLIPAGVGLYGHWLPDQKTNTAKMLEYWVLPRILPGQAALRALFHNTTRYWQDLAAVLETPKKIYPVTPYEVTSDFGNPLTLSTWMPEYEMKSLAINFTEEELLEVKFKIKGSLQQSRKKSGILPQVQKKGKKPVPSKMEKRIPSKKKKKAY